MHIHTIARPRYRFYIVLIDENGNLGSFPVGLRSGMMSPGSFCLTSLIIVLSFH